jgi:hypothetical protein
MGKKIFNLVITSITVVLILAVVIADFVKGVDAGYNDSHNIYFNEEYLFFLYGAISLFTGALIDLIYYHKYLKSSETVKGIAPFVAVAFVMSYFTKQFFKTLNKGKGFNDLYFILTIVLVSLTIYFAIDAFKCLHKYLTKKNN